MSISTFFRIILIAISADVAHKVTRLLVYNQNYIWNWCLMDKSIFDFSDSIISDAIFLVVIGPFVEELIFRYFGFKLVRHFYPKISTLYLILVTSFAFTLSHNQYWSVDINWSVLTGIFLYGLLYGWIFAIRGKLLDSFALHSASNLIVMLSTNNRIFPDNYCIQLNGWVGGVELSLILVAAAFATLALLLGLHKRA